MTISIDKILPIRAQDYVGFDIRITEQYKVVGVHSVSTCATGAINKFAEKVPSEAVVVVDYKVEPSVDQYDFRYISCGTALIPKY